MKKLIIVCEEKCKAYGDYLAQLISLDDDTEENTVGPKDGEVVARVWTEKQYNDNSQQIASNQYILFVGNKKMVKEKSAHMQIKFSEFGMSYGWLGKQAFLTVSKVVDSKKYDDFLSYAVQYQNDLEKLKKANDERHKLQEAAKAAGGVALIAALPEVLAPVAGANVFKMVTLRKKIMAQQFSCAIMKFYLESLGEFLGI